MSASFPMSFLRLYSVHTSSRLNEWMRGGNGLCRVQWAFEGVPMSLGLPRIRAEAVLCADHLVPTVARRSLLSAHSSSIALPLRSRRPSPIYGNTIDAERSDKVAVASECGLPLLETQSG